jgi:hypothetical protein
MPKSKHRKNQKQKSRQRTLRLGDQKKKEMEQYFEMLSQAQKEQKQSETTVPSNPYDLTDK